MSAEEVEAVLEGGHDIAVDTVCLAVLARVSADGAADVAAFAQDIVGAQHDCSGLLV